MGEYNKALEDFTTAINLSPTKTYYSNRAKTHKTLGSYAKANADMIISIIAPDL